MSKEFSFVFRNTVNGNFIKILQYQHPVIQGLGTYSFDTRVDKGDLFLNGEGGVLSLFQKFLETFTTVESLFGSCVEIGSELSEGCDFTVLGQKQFQGTGDLFHSLSSATILLKRYFKLGSGTDTGDGETDVDGRSDTSEKQFGFQEDLS
jgi:hypothetical protein